MTTPTRPSRYTTTLISTDPTFNDHALSDTTLLHQLVMSTHPNNRGQTPRKTMNILWVAQPQPDPTRLKLHIQSTTPPDPNNITSRLKHTTTLTTTLTPPPPTRGAFYTALNNTSPHHTIDWFTHHAAKHHLTIHNPRLTAEATVRGMRGRTPVNYRQHILVGHYEFCEEHRETVEDFLIAGVGGAKSFGMGLVLLR